MLILGTIEDRQLPFFVELKSLNYPSKCGKAIAKIVKVETTGDPTRIEEWLGSNLEICLQRMWLGPGSNRRPNDFQSFARTN